MKRFLQKIAQVFPYVWKALKCVFGFKPSKTFCHTVEVIVSAVTDEEEDTSSIVSEDSVKGGK